LYYLVRTRTYYNEHSYTYIHVHIDGLCVRSAFVYTTSGGPNRGYPGTRRATRLRCICIHNIYIIHIYGIMYTHTHTHPYTVVATATAAVAAVARDTRLPLSTTTTTTTPVSVWRTRDAYPIRDSLSLSHTHTLSFSLCIWRIYKIVIYIFL